MKATVKIHWLSLIIVVGLSDNSTLDKHRNMSIEINIIDRLSQFIEEEMRSCSMDFGCITPLYVYRMWGGTVPLKEIEDALRVHDARFMVKV